MQEVRTIHLNADIDDVFGWMRRAAVKEIRMGSKFLKGIDWGNGTWWRLPPVHAAQVM